jgi:hypothetical protein
VIAITLKSVYQDIDYFLECTLNDKDLSKVLNTDEIEKLFDTIFEMKDVLKEHIAKNRL